MEVDPCGDPEGLFNINKKYILRLLLSSLNRS